MEKRFSARYGVIAALLIAAMMLAGGATTANAQLFSACLDTLALYSPPSLDVRYQVEADKESGTRIGWDPVPVEETGCYSLAVDPDLAGRVNPEFSGYYTNLFDQSITFTFVDSATVGTKSADRVRVSLTTNPPAGAAVPALGGNFNLSNRGGFYRVTLTGSVTGAQTNLGVPNHLPQTDINDMTVWTAQGGGSSRIYAAIQDVPVVYSDDGGATWVEPALDQIDPIGFPVQHLAVDPLQQDILFAGTRKKGLWRSLDGGQTFESLDPTGQATSTTSQEVGVLEVLPIEVGGQTINRLYVNIVGVALYYSDDNGDSWTEIAMPLVPPVNQPPDEGFPCPDDIIATPITANVMSLATGIQNPGRLYVGTNDFGVLHTDDHGASWSAVDTFLVKCGSGADIEDMIVLPNGGGADWIIASTTRSGVFVSQDGGSSWLTSLGLPDNPSTGFPIVLSDFVLDPNDPNRVYAATVNDGVYVTDFRGSAWAPLAYDSNDVPTPRIGSLTLNPLSAESELIVGTVGAGVYEPGAWIDLSRTLGRPAEPFEDWDISLGLSLRFQAGPVDDGETMQLRVQSYQGYAVWRADRRDLTTGEPLWQLIGLYDLTNPESCVIGTCDDRSPTIVPGCFAEKRANCFSFYANGRVDFFDRDVFTGFTYQYAVSTFDYGFVGNTSPGSFAGEMLFSPRSAMESTPEAVLFNDISPIGSNRNYNHVEFQVNPDVAPDLDDVYVAPNPLRRRAGWDDGDESSVRFFNIAAGATCEVFTLAGDLVRRLRNVNIGGETRGIIEWDTRNEAGEQVTSGVYIYRITTPDGDEKVDHFTIIR